MVYSADSLDHIKSPWLKHGDKRAKTAFETAYLKYVAKHHSAMRSRPVAHRILPKAVVECIDPDLLMYICTRGLKKRYRTKDPTRVSAARVHDWVMKRKKNVLGLEDEDGLKKLKALRLNITGENGVRSVQTTFIEVDKIRTQYRLKKKQEYIVKELVREMMPLEIRKAVRGLLGQDTKKAKKANKKITHLHDLIMKIAVKTEEAAALGLTATKEKKGPPKPPKREREQEKIKV